jgi:hypothetical protein
MEVLPAQKRINQGLSICIFPEGEVPMMNRYFRYFFKDGASISD